MLFHLQDARRSAAVYLRECTELLDGEQRRSLTQIADHYDTISEEISRFRDKVKFCSDTREAQNLNNYTGVITRELRKEQINLLRKVLKLEQDNVELAKFILS